MASQTESMKVIGKIKGRPAQPLIGGKNIVENLSETENHYFSHLGSEWIGNILKVKRIIAQMERK
jgi:hypothetical protein